MVFEGKTSGTRREEVAAVYPDVAQVALVNRKAGAIARPAVVVARAALVAREKKAAEHQLAAIPALKALPLTARELVAHVSLSEMRQPEASEHSLQRRANELHQT